MIIFGLSELQLTITIVDAACMQARGKWESCQTDLFEDPDAPIGNPDARNELVASCLCSASPTWVSTISDCLGCISLLSENMLVHDTLTTCAQDVCDKKQTLAQLETYAYQFGQSLEFPLILPSLWINGTQLTYPDQIVIGEAV